MADAYGQKGTFAPSEPRLENIIRAAKDDLPRLVLLEDWVWDMSMEAVAARLQLDRIAGRPVVRSL